MGRRSTSSAGTGARTERRDIAAFVESPRDGGSRIGFFVSRPGFARRAKASMRAAYHRDRVLVVPLTGSQITKTLENGEEPGSFFKQLMRDTRLGRMP